MFNFFGLIDNKTREFIRRTQHLDMLEFTNDTSRTPRQPIYKEIVGKVRTILAKDEEVS